MYFGIFSILASLLVFLLYSYLYFSIFSILVFLSHLHCPAPLLVFLLYCYSVSSVFWYFTAFPGTLLLFVFQYFQYSSISNHTTFCILDTLLLTVLPMYDLQNCHVTFKRKWFQCNFCINTTLFCYSCSLFWREGINIWIAITFYILVQNISTIYSSSKSWTRISLFLFNIWKRGNISIAI